MKSMVKRLHDRFCVDGKERLNDLRLSPTAEDGSNGTVQFAPIPGPAYVSGFRSGHGVPELNTPKFDRPPGAVPNIGPIPGAHLQRQACLPYLQWLLRPAPACLKMTPTAHASGKDAISLP